MQTIHSVEQNGPDQLIFNEVDPKQSKQQQVLKIILTEGQEISSIHDINSIYDSFNLPSWFPEHYQTKVKLKSPCLYEVEFRTGQETRTYFFHQTKRQVAIDKKNVFDEALKKVADAWGKAHEEYEEAKQQYLKVRKQLQGKHSAIIDYRITTTLSSKQYRINVTFENLSEWNYIAINIEDKDDYFKAMGDSEAPRIPTRWPYRKNELYYPYIEPQNIRTVTHQGPHFHMAFQGGGAKGAAYVGAVHALLQCSPNVPIKSIIGSSAGGIIAMALAAGTSSESLIGYCERMIEIPKDTTARRKDDTVSKDKSGMVLGMLKEAIQQYGLVPKSAFYLIEGILTPQFIETALELLSHAMDGIGQMFVFPDDDVEGKSYSTGLHEKEELPRSMPRVDKRCNDTQEKKKGNYYGLVQGQLLRGDAVKQLTLDILVEYINKQLGKGSANEKLIKGWQPKIDPSDSRVIRKTAESLTMLQFYQLTDVEFTVTSVDIDSKILRFFNHKTTPDLPVHMAVIMTGSFPVAFEARKWERSWGKYYIHYERWRREIDLTGHQFTDGGMLANFPMMYLDNEDMRPMYFSRKCVFEADNSQNNTRIIGFGLQEIEETNPKVDPSKKTVSQLMEVLSKLASKNLPLGWEISMAWHYLWADEMEKERAYDLSQIPIFNFLYKLVKTYTASSENLVAQCFEMATCFQSPYKSIAKTIDIQIQEDESQRKQRQQLQAKVKQKAMKDLNDLVNEAMDFTKGEQILRNTTNDYLLLAKLSSCSADHYESVRTHLINLFGALQNIDIAKQRLLKSIADLQMSAQFKPKESCDKQQVDQELSQLQTKLKIVINTLKQLESARCNEPLIGTLQSESIIPLVDIWEKYQEWYPKPASTVLELVSQSEIKQIDDLVAKWVSFPIRDMFSKTQTGESIKRLVRETFRRYDIWQKLQFQERKEEIRDYINKKLSEENQPKNIHLVFQGRGGNNIFLYRIFKLTEDCIFRRKHNSQYKAERNAAAAILQYINPKGQERKILCNYSQSDLKMLIQHQLVLGLPQLIKNRKFVFSELSGINGSDTISFEEESNIYKQLIELRNSVEERNFLQQQQNQQKQYQITSVTCGSMHSYFGFLLAAGLSTEEVESEWDFVEKSFTFDVKSSIQQFHKQKWMLTDKFKINQQFQEEIWSERHELFSHLQKTIREAESMQKPEATKRLLAQLEHVRYQFEESKHTILNSYDMVLEHLMASKKEYQSDEDFPQKLAQSMSLNVEKENYFAKNKKISEETKAFVSMIQEYFEEQIRFMLYLFANEMEKELVDHPNLKPEDKKEMWKCMVITRFLTCKKLKNKVKYILSRLKLPKHITLKDFYNMAPRKLELTFPAVDLTNKKMRFINKNTYPDMPVWAAVAIGSSLPLIFPAFEARRSWCREAFSSSSLRIVKAFFEEDGFTYSPVFVSGNMITNFPLDLLTNRKIRKQFFAQKDYTMMNFGVIDLEPKENNELNCKFTRKYFSLPQLTNIPKLFELSKGFSMKTSLRYNLLATYMESHDNLVLELYNKELLQLPVRFSTLSFYKFKREGEGGGKISQVLKTLLEETYFSTKEKFRNIYGRSIPKFGQSISLPMESYIEMSLPTAQSLNPIASDPPLQPALSENQQYEPAKTYISTRLVEKRQQQKQPKPAKTAIAEETEAEKILVLEFISKERSSQDFTKKYKIEYRLERKTLATQEISNKAKEEVPWNKVLNQKIELPCKSIINKGYQTSNTATDKGCRIEESSHRERSDIKVPQVTSLQQIMELEKPPSSHLTESQQYQPKSNMNNSISIQQQGMNRQPQMVYLRFSYPVKFVDEKDLHGKGNKMYGIKSLEFELDVSDLWNLQEDAIFEIAYKTVGKGYLEQPPRLSNKIQEREIQTSKTEVMSIPAPRKRTTNVRLPYKTVVDLGKTGLYCTQCCKELQQRGTTPPLFSTCKDCKPPCSKCKPPLISNCGRCKRVRSIAFECSQENGSHQKYCLECCKDHAIVYNNGISCKEKHKYIAQDITRMPPSQRLLFLCDICQSSVNLFYYDQQCRSSICARCCTQLSFANNSWR